MEIHTRWQTLRLPWGVEWEKAARGVDGRHFPWGDFMEPLWCATLETGCETPQPIDSFPIDHSPYGVRGMAGNVSDWFGLYNLSNPNLKITSLSNMNGCVRGGHGTSHPLKVPCTAEILWSAVKEMSMLDFDFCAKRYKHPKI